MKIAPNTAPVNESETAPALQPETPVNEEKSSDTDLRIGGYDMGGWGFSMYAGSSLPPYNLDDGIRSAGATGGVSLQARLPYGLGVKTAVLGRAVTLENVAAQGTASSQIVSESLYMLPTFLEWHTPYLNLAGVWRVSLDAGLGVAMKTEYSSQAFDAHNSPYKYPWDRVTGSDATPAYDVAPLVGCGVELSYPTLGEQAAHGPTFRLGYMDDVASRGSGFLTLGMGAYFNFENL